MGRWIVLMSALGFGCRLSPELPPEPALKPVTQRELMRTAGDRPVNLVAYPGRSDEVALVLAGVHGSEASAIELVT